MTNVRVELADESFTHISKVKSPKPTALFALFILINEVVVGLLKQALPGKSDVADAIGLTAIDIAGNTLSKRE